MNYFIEGLQGSGKSTLVTKLSAKYPDYRYITEGDYSPIELAWCAKVSREEYGAILTKYDRIRHEIEEKSHEEEDGIVICYTKIMTDIPGFYQDLEKHEIYNGRIPFEDFKTMILTRFSNWKSDGNIFECSIFQNIVEDMILFRNATDDEILDLYRQIAAVLEGKEYHIVYLKAADIPSNIAVIRKERSDDQGNELWFPMMMGFFDNCPYSKANGVSGEEALYEHLAHRQEIELRICREIFPGRFTVLESKGYKEEDLP